jgi:uncharacterized protein YggE
MLKQILSLSLILLMALTIFGGASGSSFADAAAVSDESLISVSGKGTISVKPDTATVQIGYEARNASATSAMEEARVKMAAVIKSIKALGIADKDIKTTTIALYRNIEYNNEQKEVYYLAANTVEVKIVVIDSVGKILDASTKAGANVIGAIRFETSEYDKQYKEALKLAAKDATSKADVILTSMGLTRGKPAKITENSTNNGILYSDARMMSAESSVMTPVEAGMIEIIAHLTIEFRF